MVGEIRRKNKSIKEYPHKADLLAQEAAEARRDGGWQGSDPPALSRCFFLPGHCRGTAQAAKGAQGSRGLSNTPGWPQLPAQSQDRQRGSWRAPALWSSPGVRGQEMGAHGARNGGLLHHHLHPAMVKPRRSCCTLPLDRRDFCLRSCCSVVVLVPGGPRPCDNSFKMLFIRSNAPKNERTIQTTRCPSRGWEPQAVLQHSFWGIAEPGAGKDLCSPAINQLCHHGHHCVPPGATSRFFRTLPGM